MATTSTFMLEKYEGTETQFNNQNQDRLLGFTTDNDRLRYQAVGGARFEFSNDADVLLKAGGVMTGILDMNGNEIILSPDGDTSVTADTNDRIDFKINASDQVVWHSALMTFNAAGGDIDTRFSGENEINLLYLDAENDKMGVGTATPAALLEAEKNQSGVTTILVNNNNNTGAIAGFKAEANTAAGTFQAFSSTFNPTHFQDRVRVAADENTTSLIFMAQKATGVIEFYTGGSNAENKIATLDDTGQSGWGRVPTVKFDIYSAAEADQELLLFTDSASGEAIVNIKSDGDHARLKIDGGNEENINFVQSTFNIIAATGSFVIDEGGVQILNLDGAGNRITLDGTFGSADIYMECTGGKSLVMFTDDEGGTDTDQLVFKCDVVGGQTMVNRTAIYFANEEGGGDVTNTYAMELESEFIEDNEVLETTTKHIKVKTASGDMFIRLWADA